MQECREQELQFHAMNPGLRIALGLPDRTCEQICQEWLDRGGQPASGVMAPAGVLTPEMLQNAFDELWKGGPIRPDPPWQ